MLEKKSLFRCLLISLVLAVPFTLLMQKMIPGVALQKIFVIMLTICFISGIIVLMVENKWAGQNAVFSVKEDMIDGEETGIVKWFDGNKGYGFITRGNGGDVFVHFRAINTRGKRRFLSEGEKVKFRVTEGEKGPQAEDVTIIAV